MVVNFKTEKGSWAFVKTYYSTNVEDYEVGFSDRIDNINHWWILDKSTFDGYYGSDYYVKSQKRPTLISFVKDLTEEDWEKVVDMDFGLEDTGCYVDYTKGKNYLGYWSYYTLSTAKESGESLMRSLEIYLENPIDDIETQDDCDYMFTREALEERTGSWLLIQYN